MGSDGTSKFVVKDPKSQKRTKRRDKSRGEHPAAFIHVSIILFS